MKFSKCFWIMLFVSFLLPSVTALGKNSSAPLIKGDVFTIALKTIRQKSGQIVEVAITPKAGVHCNREYPWRIKIKESINIQFSKAQYTREEAKVFSDYQAVFELPFNAAPEAGEASLEIKFSMCDDRQCFMKTVPVKYMP